MDYGYYYDNARSRYYNACSEINSCERRIEEYEAERQKKIKLINQLKTDIKNNEKAYEDVCTIIKSDTDLNSKLSTITTVTNKATVNYSSMVVSNSIVNKNLNTVFSDETKSTTLTLNSILSTLKSKNNILHNKIVDLKDKLRSAQTQLENIESKIRSTRSSLQDWRCTKRNASYDMEYYSRKMDED